MDVANSRDLENTHSEMHHLTFVSDITPERYIWPVLQTSLCEREKKTKTSPFLLPYLERKVLKSKKGGGGGTETAYFLFPVFKE